MIDKAYGGDIIGVFDPGIFSIGDTLTNSPEKFAYEGIPTFAPEHFARVRQVDTMKRKQFIKGINQIAQEGAIQIFQEFNTGMEEIIVGAEMPKFYRPPQGIYSEENLKMAQELGYKTVFWSLAYVDWLNDKQPTREEAFRKLLPRTHNGAVVLLHSTSKTNAEILDDLLTQWENLGYRFGSLEELFV